jgi:rubrerythrin
MHTITKENLKAAFSVESQAHMKYLIFSVKAEDEGFKDIARLFRAVAFAEQVHASNHLNALNGANLTKDNLDIAIEGENFEMYEMYPAYKAVAELQEEKRAVKSLHYALEAEKIHAALYGEARDMAGIGKDLEIGEIHICSACGLTVVGAAPHTCPICGMQGENFKGF